MPRPETLSRARLVPAREALLIGKQQQFVSPGQNGRQRRQVIVVAHLDFGGGDGVVLIDYRHDAVIQQRRHGVARVEEALAVLQIGTRQQHLPDVNAVNGEQLFPQLDQPALPYRCQQLLGGDGGGQLGVAQVFAPGGDGAGSDDDNAVARGVLLRTLAHQFDNVGAVQTQRSAGQHAGAQFHNQCLAAVHSISAVCNDEKKSAKVFVTGETRYANRHNAKSAQYVVKRGQAESLISFSLKSSAGSSPSSMVASSSPRRRWKSRRVSSSLAFTSSSLMFCAVQSPSLSNRPNWYE